MKTIENILISIVSGGIIANLTMLVVMNKFIDDKLFFLTNKDVITDIVFVSLMMGVGLFSILLGTLLKLSEKED